MVITGPAGDAPYAVAVVSGPTDQPLLALRLTIDAAPGEISLVGSR